MTEKHPIPDELLIDHIAVLAKTGAGKSYLGKGIVERLLKRNERVCIIDPKNAWWGLKSSADGKTPAFPIIIFGGPNADVPLLGTHGKILGEAVATGHMSCIICTKGMPEGERVRFLTDFLQTLDMKNTQPLNLVLDEAHMLAPQKPLGEFQRLNHYTCELVSGGRGQGFRIILLSQRPARLNKDALTQCETLVAMRMTGPQDRDAVWAWIHDQADEDTGKEIVASLPKLQSGEGWVWSPRHDILKRVKFPLITTYDNSATEKNATADKRAKLAPVDLAALEAKLGAAKTELDARDPAKLKARIAELEKQVAAKPAPAPAKADTKADNTRIRSEGYNAGWAAAMKEQAKAVTAFNRLTEAHERAVKSWVGLLGRYLQKLNEAFSAPIPAEWPKMPMPIISDPQPDLRQERLAQVASALAPKFETVALAPASTGSAGDSPDLDGRERKVLASLAWWRALGHHRPSNVQVAFVAGYSPNSTSYTNPRGGLISKGLATYPDKDRVALTDVGINYAIIPDEMAAMTVFEAVLKQLDGRQAKLFNALKAAYPNSMTNDELAAAASYSPTSTSYTNPRGELRSLGILEYPSKNEVKMCGWLFGEAA